MNSQNRLSFEYEFGNESLIQIFHSLNTKQTSILPFAVTSMGDFDCDKRYFTRRTGLEECILLYTIDGNGIVEYNGKKVY